MGRNQLRAYLGLRPRHNWVIHPQNNSIIGLKFAFEIKNSGQTPARECRLFAYATWVGGDYLTYDPTVRAAEREVGVTYCVPGAEIPSVDFESGIDVVKSEIAAKRVAICYLKVSYVDAFKKARFVEGCFYGIVKEIPPDVRDERRMMASVTVKAFPRHNNGN